MEIEPSKEDVITALNMLHSVRRLEQPIFFVPLEENHVYFQYSDIIDKKIEKIADKIGSIKTDQEFKNYLKKPKTQKNIFLILYATQFNSAAFNIEENINAFSVEQPCRVLSPLVNAVFYQGFLEVEEEAPKSYIKDIITHMQLFNSIDAFADYTDKEDDPRYSRSIRLGVISDRDMGEGYPSLYIYPDYFLSNPRLIQNAATKIRKELLLDSFYKKYKTLDNYFDKSKIAKPLINTILNDSEGINYTEKTCLEAISNAYSIRDRGCVLKNYKVNLSDNFEDICDERDAQLDLSYRNSYYVENIINDLINDAPSFEEHEEANYDEDNNHGFATAEFDELETVFDSDDVMDEVILIALNKKFDVSRLEDKILQVQNNRQKSMLYADYKSSSILFELFCDIKEGEETDLYDFVFSLNDVVTCLNAFDEDQSLTRMSEEYISLIEDTFIYYKKEYNLELFENSKLLYDKFRSFSKEIGKINIDIKYSYKPPSSEGDIQP